MLFESPEYFVDNPMALLSPAMIYAGTAVYSLLKIANAITALSKSEVLRDVWSRFQGIDVSKAGQLEYAMSMSDACRASGDVEGQVAWLAFTEQLGKQYVSHE